MTDVSVCAKSCELISAGRETNQATGRKMHADHDKRLTANFIKQVMDESHDHGFVARLASGRLTKIFDKGASMTGARAMELLSLALQAMHMLLSVAVKNEERRQLLL